MNISDLMHEANSTATEKGWWEKDKPFSESIALMHSELSEALEEWRKFGLNRDALLYTKVGVAVAVLAIRHRNPAQGLEFARAIVLKVGFPFVNAKQPSHGRPPVLPGASVACRTLLSCTNDKAAEDSKYRSCRPSRLAERGQRRLLAKLRKQGTCRQASRPHR